MAAQPAEEPRLPDGHPVLRDQLGQVAYQDRPLGRGDRLGEPHQRTLRLDLLLPQPERAAQDLHRPLGRHGLALGPRRRVQRDVASRAADLGQHHAGHPVPEPHGPLQPRRERQRVEARLVDQRHAPPLPEGRDLLAHPVGGVDVPGQGAAAVSVAQGRRHVPAYEQGLTPGIDHYAKVAKLRMAENR